MELLPELEGPRHNLLLRQPVQRRRGRSGGGSRGPADHPDAGVLLRDDGARAGLRFFFLLRGKGGKLFAVAGTLAFPVAVAALISFISVYFYELPTHHCPFCILQKEYHYVGYLIYAAILGGGTASAGVWALMPFRTVPSLKEALPRIQRRLVGAAFLFYAGFTALAIGRMAFSDFFLTGY